MSIRNMFKLFVQNGIYRKVTLLLVKTIQNLQTTKSDSLKHCVLIVLLIRNNLICQSNNRSKRINTINRSQQYYNSTLSQYILITVVTNIEKYTYALKTISQRFRFIWTQLKQCHHYIISTNLFVSLINTILNNLSC